MVELKARLMTRCLLPERDRKISVQKVSRCPTYAATKARSDPLHGNQPTGPNFLEAWNVGQTLKFKGSRSR
jgi:hypothetical protein